MVFQYSFRSVQQIKNAENFNISLSRGTWVCNPLDLYGVGRFTPRVRQIISAGVIGLFRHPIL